MMGLKLGGEKQHTFLNLHQLDEVFRPAWNTAKDRNEDETEDVESCMDSKA